MHVHIHVYITQCAGDTKEFGRLYFQYTKHDKQVVVWDLISPGPHPAYD